MSTNCTIRIKRRDGTQTGIYCHCDGYINGVGRILQTAYNSVERVEKLLELGDLSILGIHINPNPNEEHSFSGHRQENVCVAYHRDRGEKYRQSDYDNEYVYTFSEAENIWYVEWSDYVFDPKGDFAAFYDKGYHKVEHKMPLYNALTMEER